MADDVDDTDYMDDDTPRWAAWLIAFGLMALHVGAYWLASVLFERAGW